MARRPRVTSAVYPYLPIRVELRRQQLSGSALVDTGFTGDLVLPASILDDALGLPDARIDWELADSSTIDAPIYFGTLEIVGLPSAFAAITVLGTEYILGRGIIDRFRVTFDHGRRIIVEPWPTRYRRIISDQDRRTLPAHRGHA
jgi:predicted aspartyl protease